MVDFEFLVVGSGIAGASVAALLGSPPPWRSAKAVPDDLAVLGLEAAALSPARVG